MSDKSLTIIGLILAIIAILVSLFIPEIRKHVFGLDGPETTETRDTYPSGKSTRELEPPPTTEIDKILPNFEGLDIDAAKNLAKSQGLETKVIEKPFDPSRKSGIVIQQNPLPGTSITEDLVLKLSFISHKASQVILPLVLREDDYNSYTEKIEKLNLKHSIKDRYFDPNLQEGTILYLYQGDNKIELEDLRSQISVPIGTELKFVTTSRGGREIRVPDLVCRTYDEALFFIDGINLSIDVVANDFTKNNKSFGNAYVYKTEPSFGAMTNMGSTIKVYLSKNHPISCNQ